MTRSRAMHSAAIFMLVGLLPDLTVGFAVAQEPSTRNELIAGSGSTPTSPAAPIERSPVQNNSPLSPAAKLLPGNVWPSQAIGRPNPLWAIPIASLTATRERPILSPSRRPPAVVVSPASQPSAVQANEPNRPLLALVGTVAAAPEGIAIFQDEKSKNIVRLRTGESHAGWTLTAVKAREATLLHGQETAVLIIPSPPAH